MAVTPWNAQGQTTMAPRSRISSALCRAALGDVEGHRSTLVVVAVTKSAPDARSAAARRSTTSLQPRFRRGSLRNPR